MEQFFYSIPISSKAQEYFLQMTKSPSHELINEIYQTYEIQELYLILNDYWKNSAPTSERLKLLSSSTFRVGTNEVFKFQK